MNPALSELRDRLRQASRVVWHQNSHLDDAAAQWFLRTVVGVQADFVYQPNDAIQIDPQAGEIGLDVMHEHAIKGYKLEDGGYSSVFRCVVEAFMGDNALMMKALKPIVDWVDTNDSAGSVTRAWLGEEHQAIEAVGLNAMHEAFKARHPGDDREAMLDFGSAVLTPLFEYHLKLAEAEQRMLESCRFEVLGRMGVCDGPVEPEALRLPSRHLDQLAHNQNQPRPEVLLYQDPNVGMGMVRIRGHLRLDSAVFQKRLDNGSWFFHPGGFLAACGTATAPRSPRQAGLSFEELISFMQEVLNSREQNASV